MEEGSIEILVILNLKMSLRRWEWLHLGFGGQVAPGLMWTATVGLIFISALLMVLTGFSSIKPGRDLKIRPKNKDSLSRELV